MAPVQQSLQQPIQHKKRTQKKVDRTKKNAWNRQYFQKLKLRPQAYKAHKEKNAIYQSNYLRNLSEEKKKERRLKLSRHSKEYFRRRREKDPTYKTYDSRTQLRKRVREGDATEEDMKKYQELLERNSKSVKKYVLSKKNGSKDDLKDNK